MFNAKCVSCKSRKMSHRLRIENESMSMFHSLFLCFAKLYKFKKILGIFYLARAFIPFRFIHCRLQPHVDTRAKQIAAWKSLVLEYYRITKQAVVDVREVHTNPLFNNTNINSILLLCVESKNNYFAI